MSGMPGTLECDVLVVGGGINGAGIARDAAGRGLRVVLCEKDDLGQHTSSRSSKLIHGGLRYLEHGQFALVRKALAERELLLASAPHIMRPLRFVVPFDAGQRPAWMIRAGLFLYDRLAPRAFLPASTGLDLASDPAGAPLKPSFARGFAYPDGWVDDARLVVLNALDAHERGATILPRTRCSRVARHARHWAATLAGEGGRIEVEARCLVNAAGPWAGHFRQMAGGAAPQRALRLVKGSHIVVPRLFEHEHAYLFQHPDGRVVFAIPYEESFTLIGTTDVEFDGDLDDVRISDDEISYLCRLANRYFVRQIYPEHVVWSYAGVRPLAGDGGGSASAATRDFRLETDTTGAPLLHVLGGKITTYRTLAEQAVDWIAPALGVRARGWTARACLPGGDLGGDGAQARNVPGFDGWAAARRQQYPWLPAPLAARLARAYGTRMERLLQGCGKLADLGPEVVPGLFAAEIDYLMRHEWARGAQDILWRRSKLGLHLPPAAAGQLDAWIAQRRQPEDAARRGHPACPAGGAPEPTLG